MSETVLQVSPPANVGFNFGADISFASFGNGFTGTVISTDFLEFGTVAKGLTDQMLYVMFEIPDPAGTVFSSVVFTTKLTVSQGDDFDKPFIFGVIKKDGVWNDQLDFLPRGLSQYLTFFDFPHALTDSNINWASGSASIVDSVPADIGPAGSLTTWGSNGTGSLFENVKFLTDIQSAFDDNESDRNARGVPILLQLHPTDSFIHTHRWHSQNATLLADRPTLTLDTAFDLGNIFDVIARTQQGDIVAMAQQTDVVARPQQTYVVARPQQVDVVARPQQADVAARPQQADVVAKPQEIDVVAEAEDGND